MSASQNFRTVERNLSRIYYLELLEHLQNEQFLADLQRAAEEAVSTVVPEEATAVSAPG